MGSLVIVSKMLSYEINELLETEIGDWKFGDAMVFERPHLGLPLFIEEVIHDQNSTHIY